MGEKKEKKEKKKKKEETSEAEEAGGDAGEESGGGGGGSKKPVGNVFALFKQAQIQEFKEAFTMIDQDRDGLIGENDLAAIYQQIGLNPDPKQLKEMLKEAPGQLNFTHFLTLFGEKMHGTDPEATLRDSFKMFDPEGTGKLAEEYVKDLLMNVGDQFSKDEIKQTWKEAPIEGGQLDYMKFVQIIKRGKEEE